ncbi:sulfatase [Amycolatopsis jejuensis]|uniref:sulfatase n=1 Tax=Amycolatopsis jejuensis TaxID=330084 RepID=UPI0005263968|nr:sulfatase [Amycolatopsis jejuensis]
MRTARGVATVLAALLVLAALVLPGTVAGVTPAAFVRIPVEALVVAALALVLPPRGRTVLAVVSGVLLGMVVVLKAADLGFDAVLSRPFDPVLDWSFVIAGLEFAGRFAVAGVLVAIAGVLVLMVVAVRWLTRLAVGRRTVSTRVVAVLSVIWIAAALTGAEFTPGQPFASRSAVALAYDDLRRVGADLDDRAEFAAQVAADRTAVPLDGLRGKDVLFAFVESYGRGAVDGVARQLDEATAELHHAGFSARSGFLESPTFGGGSWLAHATFQSGTWVNNQQRYTDLLAGQRLTLTRAFGAAGWRTVHDVPAHTRPWPEGRFYGFEQYYDAHNVGYRGPGFAYATMPDQFTLSALQHRELDPRGRRPVMAEVDLVSSHAPWTPRPSSVDWNTVGDGSGYGVGPPVGEPPEVVWQDPARIRAAYGEAIRYSLATLVSYVERYGGENTVLVFLGDHQPPMVSPPGASHQVPVTIVAKDSSVLARVAGWGWTAGLRPASDAPVWRMDAFRDRFFAAFAR